MPLNLKLKHKIMLLWFGTVIVTLLSVGFLFTFLITDLQKKTSQEHILKSFEILRQELEHGENHLIESTGLLTGKKEVIASLNLISGYQDPANYNATLFGGEKRRLVAEFADHAQVSGLDLIAAYDADSALSAFYVRSAKDRQTFGYESFHNGAPVYYIGMGQNGPFSETLTVPELVETVNVPAISSLASFALKPSLRGVAMELTAPVKVMAPDGTERLVGAIQAIRFLDEGFAKKMSGTTGAEFLYVAANHAVVASHESSTLAKINMPPMPHNMPALDNLHITSDAVRWIPSETYFLGAAHIELTQGEKTIFLFGIPNDLLTSELRAFRKAEILALLLVGLLVGPGGILYINRAVSAPIDKLVKGANAIREGDYRKISGFDAGDELSTLAQSFNAMSETIHQREADLNMFSEAVEHSPAGVILTDPLGRINYVNQKFTEMTGYELPDVVGETPEILNPLEQSPETVQKMWKAVRAGSEWRGELLNRRRNNTTFWTFVSISAIKSEAGKITHFVAVVEDISERKQAEAKILQMNQDLERRVAERTRELLKAKEDSEIANRAKSEFLANMSHELRTPLNAVIGFADAMSRELFGPIGEKRYVEYVVNIRDSGHHLLELINDILDLSRVEAGKMELYEENIDVGQAIDNVIKLIRLRSAKMDIILLSDTPPDMPLLFADELRFKQILINLLTNAVKFTPEGGTVTVSGSFEKDGSIEVSVSDTGIGMSAEDIVTALTSFGQATSDLARRQEGTGLGLPLTRALCQVHGGTLDIDSTPNIGTTVTVTFPPERNAGKLA